MYLIALIIWLALSMAFRSALLRLALRLMPRRWRHLTDTGHRDGLIAALADHAWTLGSLAHRRLDAAQVLSWPAHRRADELYRKHLTGSLGRTECREFAEAAALVRRRAAELDRPGRLTAHRPAPAPAAIVC